VHIALSYVDLEGARSNFAAELEGRSFDDVWTTTESAWGEMLEPVRIHGGTPDHWKIFATALYHSFVMPGVYEDVDDRYVGMDGAVHTADDFTYYANFSMWDTYRTVHPLLSIIHPDRQLDMVRTLLRMAEDGGHIPRWQMCSGYTNGTVGAPADIVIADTTMRGVTGFDVDQALAFLVQDASNPPETGHPFSGRAQVESYVALGYVPADLQSRSVSWTLELAISDFAIAQLGEGRLDPAVVDDFRRRGTNYATLWDAGQRVFRGRNQDGSWATPFSAWVYESGDQFYGGNAKQYAWLVPHDMPGLLSLFPNAGVMRDDLLEMFTIAFENNPGPLDGMLPPTGYYHGNEPGLHMPYLFLVTGSPHLAQQWIDWVSSVYYTTNPNGISGNEDAGAMSAYYVWSSLGLYPVPATDLYLIGRPLFPYAEIDLPGGTLVIEAEGAGDMIYVHDVTLDGAPVPHPWIRHDQIADGAVLHFTMGAAEGSWGTDFGSP
jgi:predicted alpha-1,2-mannosidase